MSEKQSNWGKRKNEPRWRAAKSGSEAGQRQGREEYAGAHRGERQERSQRFEQGGGRSKQRSGAGFSAKGKRGGFKPGDKRAKQKGSRRDERKETFKHDYGVHDRRYQAKDWRQNNEPEIPASVSISDLEPVVRAGLRGLDKDNANLVAGHLVMAGSLLDVDPEEAYRHAYAAATRAGRIACVREATALTAYACGDYATALREARTMRRLGGSESLRYLEADCERGLGHPEKALEIVAQTDTSALEVEEVAELMLVEAGARSDLGQVETALLLLETFLEAVELGDEVALARVLSYQVDLLRSLGREEEAAQLEASIPEVPDTVSIMDVEEVLAADMPHVHCDLRGSRLPLLEACDSLLLDLDGVCYAGTNSIPGASEGLRLAREAGVKVAFVTNNSSRTPEQVCAKLFGFGIAADPGEVMTAALDGADILKRQLPPGAKVLVVGGEGVWQAVHQAGFEIVRSAEERPAAVIVGWYDKMDWSAMSEAAYAINGGAAFVATNLDATLPTERGYALGNGSLVKAIEHATSRTPLAGGKPFADIYRKATAMVGASNPLSVGDRLNTDIAGARKAGYRSLHVLTGVSGPREVALAAPEERPSFLGLDLTDLAVAHPGPVKQPTGMWTCGGSKSWGVVRSGELTCDEVQIAQESEIVVGLDDYRALIAAVWEVKDQGGYVRLPVIRVEREAKFMPVAPAASETSEAGEEAVSEPKETVVLPAEEVAPETLEAQDYEDHESYEASADEEEEYDDSLAALFTSAPVKSQAGSVE